MLNVADEREHVAAGHEPTSGAETVKHAPCDMPNKSLEKMLCFEWLGQTLASLCWIGSVLAYGISSSGDWLQLCAASSWLLANIASAVTAKND